MYGRRAAYLEKKGYVRMSKKLGEQQVSGFGIPKVRLLLTL